LRTFIGNLESYALFNAGKKATSLLNVKFEDLKNEFCMTLFIDDKPIILKGNISSEQINRFKGLIDDPRGQIISWSASFSGSSINGYYRSKNDCGIFILQEV